MTIRNLYHRIFSDNSRTKRSRRSRKPGPASCESLETRALLTVTFERADFEPNGGFADLTVGNDPFSQAFADFNNDGQLDAVVTVSDAFNAPLGFKGIAGIEVSLTMPTPPTFYPFDIGTPTSVVTGDFNSDGNIDIAVGFVDLSTVAIYSGDGHGHFPSVQSVNVGNGVYTMAAADFNGDGKMDLAVAEGDILGGNSQVKVLSGNGNNTFQNEIVLSNAAVAPGGLVTGDINGDNKVDLIVADLNAAAVSVFAGQGNGSFSAAASFAVGQNPKSVALGDFNQDGKVDLVSANEGSNTVSILRGNGDGTFQSHVDFVVGTAPRSVAVGDFNRDGKPDLVVANWGSNNVAVMEGRGTGDLAPPEFFATGYGPTNVAVADFDLNGVSDLSVLNLADRTATVLYGNGQSILRKVNAPGVTGFSVTADFDGDGFPDLANSSRNIIVLPNGQRAYDIRVDIQLGNGDGAFQTPMRIDVSGFGLATGDFNRDGNMDLVVTDLAVAHVLLGNGDGTFANEHSSSTGLIAYAFFTSAYGHVHVGDFNGDKISDLLFTGFTYQAVVHSYMGLILGNGDGTFSLPQVYGPYGSHKSVEDVVVADFNGDGKSDVAATFFDFSSGTEFFRLRLGGSTLGAEILLPIPATKITAGDFNGDGKTDLVVSDLSNTNLSLHTGNGDTTFREPLKLAGSGILDRVFNLTTADVNGDGRLDIVAQLARGVQSYVGNGDGTFQLPYFEPIIQLGGDLWGRSGPLVVDFDQNGLLDVFSSGLLLNLPIAVTISSASVAENLPIGTVVGTLNTAHPNDPGNYFSYTLISGTGSTDNGAFTLDPDGTLKTAAIFDRETKASYSIRLKSTDSIGMISEKVLTISVENVLEPPQGSSDPDAFVLTFSSTGVTITQSRNGGTPLDLGLFPLNSPIVLSGLADNDSVRIVGTSSHDLFTVSSAGLVVNSTLVTLNGPATRTLAGAAGNDVYQFDADSTLGAWALDESGGGTDTVDFTPTTTVGLVLNLATAGTQAVHATNLSLVLGSAVTIENAIGGSGADTLFGNSLDNTLTGGVGDDKLIGATGNDLLRGGANNDTYVFVPTIVAEADQVTENPNEGIDTLSFAFLTTDVVVHLGSTSIQPVHTNRTLKLNSATVFENILGGSGADTLFGNSLDNTLSGNAGNDKLLGAGGNDVLRGGANNDTYMFVPTATAEADQVIENANEGIDTLNFGYLTTSVVLNLGSTSIQTVNLNRTLKLNSVSTFENAVGGTGSDTLLGNTVANRLTGGLGDNILVGMEGADILEAGSGRDILIGGLGLDILKGDAGDDILIAGRTTSDTSLSNLNTLRTQWISANSYAARTTNLRAGVGSPLVSLKATINVLNDAGEDDVLVGGTDTDWFFRAVDDVIADLFAGELIDVL